jgi:hypothetical protein
MNRSAGNGRRLAAGEGRTARLAVSPGEPEPAATTLLQARNPAQTAEPARAQPGGAGLR